MTTPLESSLIDLVSPVSVFRDSSEVVTAYLVWPPDVNYHSEQLTLECIHLNSES